VLLHLGHFLGTFIPDSKIKPHLRHFADYIISVPYFFDLKMCFRSSTASFTDMPITLEISEGVIADFSSISAIYALLVSMGIK